jgi:lysyl-tRNA synthetase class 2
MNWNDTHGGSDLIAERVRKAREIRDNALSTRVLQEIPYANWGGTKPTTTAAELFASMGTTTFTHDDVYQIHDDVSHNVVGRVRYIRKMGKAAFVKLDDGSDVKVKPYLVGTKPSEDLFLQIFLSEDRTGEEGLQFLSDYVDLGDIVRFSGPVFVTKTGELSIAATCLQMVTKAVRPMPAKFGGVQDTELKYRQRYVDLMLNEESRKVFQARSRIVRNIRDYFHDHEYMEVETPMLHPTLGGANARPFTTHHNALDMDLYLRIAPELHLKRLLVGGFNRVFEINRNFRNEGVSRQHNPEFTMIEFYQAYANCEDLMRMFEQAMVSWASGVLGPDGTIEYGGETISLQGPFNRVSIYDTVCEILDVVDPWQHEDRLRAYASNRGVDVRGMDVGALMLAITENALEGQLVQPTFLVDYPASVSPLARKRDYDPRFVDRFELFIGNMEIANGFTELNDPEDQFNRFAAQLAAKEAGMAETMEMDLDYIRSLEYGMPPAAGAGMGIDRFVMLVTGAASIRDVILFPHMRNEV